MVLRAPVTLALEAGAASVSSAFAARLRRCSKTWLLKSMSEITPAVSCSVSAASLKIFRVDSSVYVYFVKEEKRDVQSLVCDQMKTSLHFTN